MFRSNEWKPLPKWWPDQEVSGVEGQMWLSNHIPDWHLHERGRTRTRSSTPTRKSVHPVEAVCQKSDYGSKVSFFNLFNIIQSFFFKKKLAKPGLFCLFSFFSRDKCSTNLTINYKSIDGVLGSRTRGCRMVGKDESTELWRRPKANVLYYQNSKLLWKRPVVLLVRAMEEN